MENRVNTEQISVAESALKSSIKQRAEVLQLNYSLVFYSWEGGSFYGCLSADSKYQAYASSMQTRTCGTLHLNSKDTVAFTTALFIR